MASMREIRRRIRTVRNVQQITKALKLVAAARLQRAQARAVAARPYAEHMQNLIGRLSPAAFQISHPLLEVRKPASIGVLAVTSDRGMAGGYNVNIIREVEAIVKRYDGQRVKLITVGRRGQVFFGKRGYDIASAFPMPASEVDFVEARQIGREVMSLFKGRQVDVTHLVYTRFFSALRQRVTTMQLLPIQAPSGEVAALDEYIFEPEPGTLLGSLLPRYVNNQIYQALLESLASEHGARMAAMTAATDNAQEMIDNLTLQYNRARQAAITKEIAEIVGSANALA